MISLIYALFLSLITTSVFGNVFQTAFVSFPSTKINSKSTATQLNVAVVDSARTQKLNKIKAKTTGRYDLATMVDTNDDEAALMFADADSEEVDPPTVGQTITGRIIEMDENGALLEIGGKMSGYLPMKEASLIPIKDLSAYYQIGQEVTAECIGTLKGMPVISLRPYQLQAAWEKIIQMRAADVTFEVKVIEVNRGGAVCDAYGLKAFLPGSHSSVQVDESMIGSTFNVCSLTNNILLITQLI